MHLWGGRWSPCLTLLPSWRSSRHLHFYVSWVAQICCLPEWTLDCPLQICSSTILSQFNKWGLNCSVSPAVSYPTHQPFTYLPHWVHHQVLLILLPIYILNMSVSLFFHFSVLNLTNGSNLNYYNCSLIVSQLPLFSPIIYFLPRSHRGLLKMQIWSYHFGVNPVIWFCIAFRIKPPILNMP